MPLKIVRNDITRMNTQAIVNTANRNPIVGPGCNRAVYNAAGYHDLLNYREKYIGFVPQGEAFITPGFNLSAKYIIHAVSPLYRGGNDDEENKLRSCYQKSLLLAKKYNIESIAFPLISTGGFGYPKEEGLRIALDEINAFLLNNDMLIYIVVFGEKITRLSQKIYSDLDSYIDNHYVNNKIIEEYQDDYIFPEPEVNSRYEPQPIIRESKQKSQAQYTNLNERMRQIQETFSQRLMNLIQQKNMSNSEVYNRAIIDRKIFSKIKNDINYHPQKITALCLCVGAKLNLDETKDLLSRAGYALSPSDKVDIIFSYFIEREIYDMIDLDIELEKYGLPCIIS
ncbi:MAG: macro domain-containing protein [Synergistaceae bacterium]|nr:macro domain-containing protein [Synergistaceae bacterium]